MLKKLAPLSSLDKPSLGSFDKPSQGSNDRSDVESELSHAGSNEKMNLFPTKGLNSKPLLGKIDQKVLGSIDRSSLSSVEKVSSSSSPLRKPRARDFIKEVSHNSPRHEQELDKGRKIQIGDPNISADSPISSLVSGPTKNSLRFGSNKSFLKADSADKSEIDEDSEHVGYKDTASVRGILKSSPAKIKNDIDVENARTLRQAMLQREEKRIMFDLDANIEFASEVQNFNERKEFLIIFYRQKKTLTTLLEILIVIVEKRVKVWMIQSISLNQVIDTHQYLNQRWNRCMKMIPLDQRRYPRLISKVSQKVVI